MPVPCDPICPQTTLAWQTTLRLNEENLADSECYIKSKETWKLKWVSLCIMAGIHNILPSRTAVTSNILSKQNFVCIKHASVLFTDLSLILMEKLPFRNFLCSRCWEYCETNLEITTIRKTFPRTYNLGPP